MGPWLLLSPLLWVFYGKVKSTTLTVVGLASTNLQHERLTSGLMEGRLDSGASLADPASISFDAGGANRATFGFASVGLFADHRVDSGLQNFEPRGMPLEEVDDDCQVYGLDSLARKRSRQM